MARRDTVDVFLLQETLLSEGFTPPPYRGTELTTARRSGALVSGSALHRLSAGTKPSLYRPPTADLELEELFDLAATEMVLAAGDFNSNHPWLGSPCPSNAAGRQLYASFENSDHVYLLNDVCSPMHIRHGRLDLVFASSRLAPAPAWSLQPTLTSSALSLM